MDSQPDPLGPERERYAQLATAVTDSLLEARLVRDQPDAYRDALTRSVDVQVARLAAHDQFVARASHLGAEPAVIDRLHRGRNELTTMLRQTRETIAQLTR